MDDRLKPNLTIGVHWSQWRKILSYEEFPYLISYDEGLFDPVLSFIVSHLERPVSINYKLNKVFGNFFLSIIRSAFPSAKPLFAYNSPPDFFGKDAVGNFVVYEPYPVLVSFFNEGVIALLHIYCDEEHAEEVNSLFVGGCKAEFGDKVCLISGGEGEHTWVDRVAPLPLEEVLKNFPAGVAEDIAVIRRVIDRCFSGQTRKGVAFLFLGAPGVGKTFLAKALLDDVLDGDTLGFYISQQQEATFARLLNSIKENPGIFDGKKFFFILDDAEWLLLSRKRISLASPATKTLNILDDLPPKCVVCFITNLAAELDTATIRPGRIDLILNIPPSGWGLNVFNYWAEKYQLPERVVNVVLEDETLRAAMNKLTPAEASSLVSYLQQRDALGFSCTKREIRDAIKSYTKWRRVYKERDWEEVEPDVF